MQVRDMEFKLGLLRLHHVGCSLDYVPLQGPFLFCKGAALFWDLKPNLENYPCVANAGVSLRLA